MRLTGKIPGGVDPKLLVALKELIARAQTNMRRSNAVMEGVRAARQTVAAIRNRTQSISIYGASGNKVAVDTGRVDTGRV